MSDPAGGAQQQTKKKKKLAGRPPVAVAGKNGGKKKAAGGNEGGWFPIPLAFLYRDPRPSPRRGGADYFGQPGDPDSEGLPLKETPEQLREKKTLYQANMAQAQAFLGQLRYNDARLALTKVRRHLCATFFPHLVVCVTFDGPGEKERKKDDGGPASFMAAALAPAPVLGQPGTRPPLKTSTRAPKKRKKSLYTARISIRPVVVVQHRSILEARRKSISLMHHQKIPFRSVRRPRQRSGTMGSIYQADGFGGGERDIEAIPQENARPEKPSGDALNRGQISRSRDPKPLYDDDGHGRVQKDFMEAGPSLYENRSSSSLRRRRRFGIRELGDPRTILPFGLFDWTDGLPVMLKARRTMSSSVESQGKQLGGQRRERLLGKLGRGYAERIIIRVSCVKLQSCVHHGRRPCREGRPPLCLSPSLWPAGKNAFLGWPSFQEGSSWIRRSRRKLSGDDIYSGRIAGNAVPLYNESGIELATGSILLGEKSRKRKVIGRRRRRCTFTRRHGPAPRSGRCYTASLSAAPFVSAHALGPSSSYQGPSKTISLPNESRPNVTPGRV